MKNGGKNKSVAFIILVSVYKNLFSAVLIRLLFSFLVVFAPDSCFPCCVVL